MKKIILLLVGTAILLSVKAQTWESQIQTITGKQKVKTLRIKPGRELKAGRLLTDEDSLREFNYYEGFFVGGSRDSLQISLREVQTHKVYTDGIKYQSTIPARLCPELHPGDSNILQLPLTNMDYLQIKSPKWQKTAGEIVEPLIWASMFVMFLSPMICYDYKEGAFNAERYQYWGIGSTAGLAIGFGSVIIINAFDGTKTFQFKSGWPNKKTKVWKFK